VTYKRRLRMSSEKTKVKVDVMGPVWLIGWLFTLGFLQLSFWKGLLAIIVWPYYLGDYFSKFLS
jgi:hypothetical protein